MPFFMQQYTFNTIPKTQESLMANVRYHPYSIPHLKGDKSVWKSWSKRFSQGTETATWRNGNEHKEPG